MYHKTSQTGSPAQFSPQTHPSPHPIRRKQQAIPTIVGQGDELVEAEADLLEHVDRAVVVRRGDGHDAGQAEDGVAVV